MEKKVFSKERYDTLTNKKWGKYSLILHDGREDVIEHSLNYFPEKVKIKIIFIFLFK